MNAGSGAGGEDDELAAAMREARERFVASFSGRCDEIQSGLTAEGGDGPVPDGARQAIHRLAGLAGTVGFPEVSRIASEMEGALFTATANRSQLLAAVASMREVFQRAIDVSLPNARMTPKAATGQRVLVVDDDPEQRRLITRALEIGGYNVTVLPLADTVIETAERVRSAAVLLDVMMPGINGHLACRLLKAKPSVADVPILFVSSNSALDERLAGRGDLAAGRWPPGAGCWRPAGGRARPRPRSDPTRQSGAASDPRRPRAAGSAGPVRRRCGASPAAQYSISKEVS